jgi:hypothetical protein
LDHLSLSHIRFEVTFTSPLAILEKRQPSHQIVIIPRLPKKSRQHSIARHFFRAHKSWTGVSSCHQVPVDSNFSHCHIKWSIKYTHIASSTILNLLKCDRAAYSWYSGKTFLSSLWPSNQDRRKTFGSMEWRNLPVSAVPDFLHHYLSKWELAIPWKSIGGNGLSKIVPFNAAGRARSSTNSLPSRPRWNGIHIMSTSTPQASGWQSFIWTQSKSSIFSEVE